MAYNENPPYERTTMFKRHSLQMNIVKTPKKASTETPTNPVTHEVVVHDINVQQIVKDAAKGVAGTIALYVVLDTVRRAVDNLTA